MRTVTVADIALGTPLPLVLIAGPCQIESRDHCLRLAETIAGIAGAAGLPFIFKSSFDKANRTRGDAARGVGLDHGLAALASVRSEIGCPVTTDVHLPDQCVPVAEVVDLLQIPAFLCRQTDLLRAAGATGTPVNIKKGQFLSPREMIHAAEKVADTGNRNILLTERGTTFGYNAVVNDMRALPIMADTGWPVVFDATHSVQTPGFGAGATGGDRRFVAPLARAAVAVGVAAVFLETHDDPDNAPSDGRNMVPLDDLPALLSSLVEIDRLRKANPAPFGLSTTGGGE